jgi:DNA-binding transcriptional MerR regulator
VELPLEIYEEITGLDELPPPVDEADHERRKHRRVPFGCRVTIFPERKSGDNAPSVAMVRDMSVGGLSILNSEPIKPPTPFVIEFRGRQDRPVKIRCVAARCEPGGFGATEFVVGAIFEELLTAPLSPEELQEEPPPPEPLINLVADEAEAADGVEAVTEELIEEALREPAERAAAQPVLELLDTPWQDKTSVQLEQPAPQPPPVPAAPTVAPAAPTVAPAAPTVAPAAPTVAPAAPTPAPAAVKAHAALFLRHPGGKTKKVSEIPDKESNEFAPAPAPAAPPPPEEATPVFRVIPIPEEPQTTAVVTMELGPQAPDNLGRNHEILSRVKGLLVQQEQSIERQRQELKEQRERFEKDIQSMRSELEDTKRKLAELRAKSDADDSAIADLAAFLKQHGPGQSPAQANEAA